MNREVFAAVAEALERGEPAALVTIVSTAGSTPQRNGAKMLVFADGRTVGTIGGGCYENDAFGKAREAILNRTPQLVHYELSDDFAQETGLICGGRMDVYIEPIEPSAELYVIGAGTPQEIAVSILAELIAVKHGKEHPAAMRWAPPQLSTAKSQVSK